MNNYPLFINLLTTLVYIPARCVRLCVFAREHPVNMSIIYLFCARRTPFR